MKTGITAETIPFLYQVGVVCLISALASIPVWPVYKMLTNEFDHTGKVISTGILFGLAAAFFFYVHSFDPRFVRGPGYFFLLIIVPILMGWLWSWLWRDLFQTYRQKNK
jgi:signal transduction histidine kinase